MPETEIARKYLQVVSQAKTLSFEDPEIQMRGLQWEFIGIKTEYKQKREFNSIHVQSGAKKLHRIEPLDKMQYALMMEGVFLGTDAGTWSLINHVSRER
ncbi:MAG: hypothetical protein QXZ09_06730 [Candidatus Methanomethylicaceae archaeon]